MLSRIKCRWLVVCSLLTATFAVHQTFAGNGLFQRQQVGGILVDASGIISQPSDVDIRKLCDEMKQRTKNAPQGVAQATELRKVSLRQLERAISESPTKDIDSLPEEVRFMAGIQRIKYVLVYPEQNDIVFAGPGEGWKIDDHGNVVGETTGHPVVLLEDLIVAFRTVDAARQGGISCSIDPTPEGRSALNSYLRRQNRFSQRVVANMAEKMGPQQITLSGVPETSHFARVLVGADYQMKRIAMHLEESPIDGLDSYLTRIKKSRRRVSADLMPRWWLATDYEPLAKSADGLAWEIRGQGVKAMTEDEYVNADGTVEGTGRANPLAQDWADDMTANFAELCKKESIFGQLRNIMDLCVISALIKNEGLVEKVGCEIPVLSGQDDSISMFSYHAPKSIATQCSFIKKGSNYIITASGGVMIESWQAAIKSQESRHVQELRQSVKHESNGEFWWN